MGDSIYFRREKGIWSRFVERFRRSRQKKKKEQQTNRRRKVNPAFFSGKAVHLPASSCENADQSSSSDRPLARRSFFVIFCIITPFRLN
jgi:hypothetical protein